MTHARPPHIPWDLLDRYLAGDCTPEERTEALAYLAAHPDEQAALHRVANRVTQPPHRAPDFRPRWPAMQRRMDTVTSARDQGRRLGQVGTSSVGRWTWYALAGTMAAVLAIVVGWHVNVPRLGGRGTVAMATYVTGKGERANITLPDGSTVALSVASRLEVPGDYLVGDHTIRLTGEALFSVAHHDRAPFVVLAGGTATRVLGTSFLIRHYATDTTTAVAVQDGKVAVRSVVLTAGRQVVIGRMGIARAGPVDPSAFGFATGVLTLNGVPLRDAIVELDRWYNADIRLGDPALGAREITGGFTAGSLSELTETLELTFNVRVVRDGRVLTVYPR